MFKNLYTLKDLVAEECAPIFEANNDGVAIRMFQETISRQQIPYDDFHLLRIGRYDKSTGSIIPEDPQEVVVNFSMSEEIEESQGI